MLEESTIWSCRDFCRDAISEFSRSSMRCAEVTGYECSARRLYQVMGEEIAHADRQMSCSTRRGRVYLVKGRPSKATLHRADRSDILSAGSAWGESAISGFIESGLGFSSVSTGNRSAREAYAILYRVSSRPRFKGRVRVHRKDGSVYLERIGR